MLVCISILLVNNCVKKIVLNNCNVLRYISFIVLIHLKDTLIKIQVSLDLIVKPQINTEYFLTF